jgi:FAD binding domain-containing protein/PASTA domain-containing protein
VSTTNCKSGIAWTNYPQTQSSTPYSTCRPNSLAGLVAIVKEAESAHKHVHAFGSKWSFSDCAITNDYVIDTRDLNRVLPTIKPALRAGQSLDVWYVEAGINIRNLYLSLGAKGLALQTMGGSSGQTLAGALSTGTHGGDKFMAPLSDSVLAIHLVGAGGKQFWIEPSHGITDPVLLKAHVVPDIDSKNIIYDDSVFNACLVSLGCMGIIYALVLKVRTAYDLVETTTATNWQDFKKNASAYLSDSANRFLQVLVNPYPDSKTNANLCLVTRRSEASPTKALTRPDGGVAIAVGAMLASFGPIDDGILLAKGAHNRDGLSDEEWLAKIVQLVLTYLPQDRAKMVLFYGSILGAKWPPGTVQGLSYSVMDLSYPKPHALSEPSHSIELFFPATLDNGRLGFADFVDHVIDYISHAEQTFFAGYVSLRFTGSTRAYLGMQQWKQTCAVEISVLQGVQDLPGIINVLLSDGTRNGALAHWGQEIDMAFKQHGSIYPQYANWREAYGRLSNNFSIRTFENPLSLRWNLTRPNDSKFVSQSVSEQMQPGQTQSVSVTMQNTGVTTWRKSSYYRLGSQASQDNNFWGLNRVELPMDVAPGGQVTFHFNIVAPTQGIGSGITHFFEWKMVQEAVEWFGVTTPLTTIHIVPKQGATTTVPDVMELNWSTAKKMILDAFLNPSVTGTDVPNAWVDSQVPKAGTVVATGTTVKVHIRTGAKP